ncbi:hypothetical protein ACWDTI_23845 [Gordonia sp. NPDC003424]
MSRDDQSTYPFITPAFVTPPLDTGIQGFTANNTFTAFDRRTLNRIEADKYLSNSWCPGLLWDLQRGGELRLVNYSGYAVYVAMCVPGKSTSLAYNAVKRDAEDPQNRLGSRQYGAVLDKLPRDEREPEEVAREVANTRGFVLTEPAARYRIAVGPPPGAIASDRPSYVLFVDTPGVKEGSDEEDFMSGTLVPTGHAMREVDDNAHITAELKKYLRAHRSTRYWLAFREHEAILGVPDPEIVNRDYIKKYLDDMITENGVINNLANQMGKHFDLVRLRRENPRGLTRILCRWLVDHHVLTISDVREVDNHIRRQHPNWTSLFDRHQRDSAQRIAASGNRDQ